MYIMHLLPDLYFEIEQKDFFQLKTMLNTIRGYSLSAKLRSKRPIFTSNASGNFKYTWETFSEEPMQQIIQVAHIIRLYKEVTSDVATKEKPINNVF
jgi:hypothetical protein